MTPTEKNKLLTAALERAAREFEQAAKDARSGAWKAWANQCAADCRKALAFNGRVLIA